jgi:hypothetical protein
MRFINAYAPKVRVNFAHGVVKALRLSTDSLPPIRGERPGTWIVCLPSRPRCWNPRCEGREPRSRRDAAFALAIFGFVRRVEIAVALDVAIQKTKNILDFLITQPAFREIITRSQTRFVPILGTLRILRASIGLACGGDWAQCAIPLFLIARSAAPFPRVIVAWCPGAQSSTRQRPGR